MEDKFYQELIGKQNKTLTPEDIALVCKTIERAWVEHPNWRLGQLLSNVLALPTTKLYYMSDTEIMDMLKSWK